MTCRIYNSEAFADLLNSNATELSKHSTTSTLKSRSSTTSSRTGPFNSTRSSIQHGESTTSNPSAVLNEQPLTLMERALEHHKRAIKNPHRGRKDKMTASHSRLFEEEEKKQSDTRKRNDDRIARGRQKKEAAFQHNWTTLHAGEDFDLHNEWGRRLSLLDQERLNRKKSLARQWNEEVYNPIKERVQQHAELLRARGIHHTRREEYNNFIEAVNVKGGLFLDEVDEAEYDPNVINRMSGSVRIKVNDPTIRTLQRQHEERIMNPAE